MFYGEDVVEEVRQRSDIVDIISSYVNLKRSGSNYFGLCPFHNEHSPSFSVSPGKQMYYCFGCGAGGNVFTFMMEYENLGFVEALEQLAEKAGVALPERSHSPADRQKRDLKNSVLEVHKESAKYYYARLKSSNDPAGYQYLTERGLTPETITGFGLGYAGKNSGELYRYLKRKGYPEQVLKESGLFVYDEKRGTYDKFWNRVMFPIMDRSSRVIAFGGRVMGDAKPKYLNSPETLIFDKSRTLYGLNRVHGKQEYMIICEGYMDVIALHQAGFGTAVASLGTAFTSQHAGLLKRYTDLVYLCYDSDGAGVKAAMRAIPLLRDSGLQVKAIDMRPYKDPDEFMKGLSAEAFAERIDKAKNSFFYEIDRMKQSYDMQDPESKTRFMNEVAKKCLTFDNEVERNNYIEAFAREYQVRTDDFRKLVARQSAVMAGMDYERRRTGRDDKGTGTARGDGIATSQSIFLTWLCSHPELFGKTKDIISAGDFVDEPYHQVAEMIYEQYWRDGTVQPADIISKFQSKEEQSLVAGIFNKEMGDFRGDTEQEKAVNEVIRSIKTYSLDYRGSHVTDIRELQQLVEDKKKLQTLWIKL